MGDVSFVAQLIGSVAAIVVALGFGYAVYKILDVTVGIRLDPEEEQKGSDLTIHHIASNPEETITKHL